MSIITVAAVNTTTNPLWNGPEINRGKKCFPVSAAALTGGVEIRRGRDTLNHRPKLPANYHVDDGPWTGRPRSRQRSTRPAMGMSAPHQD
jgi:hypothetical protein